MRDDLTPAAYGRDLLVGTLEAQRRHILDQLSGLTHQQLHRPVLPSGWSCLGLLRHLTLSDERYWFEVVMAGQPLDFWPNGVDADWLVRDNESAQDVLDAYRAAAQRSDDIVSAMSLDDPPRSPERSWAEDGLAFPSLRAVLVHVIVETATHRRSPRRRARTPPTASSRSCCDARSLDHPSQRKRL